VSHHYHAVLLWKNLKQEGTWVPRYALHVDVSGYQCLHASWKFV